MSDVPNEGETPAHDDLARLVEAARRDPKVAAALLADLDGQIREQGLEIDPQSPGYRELALRLYHARAVLSRNLDEVGARLSLGLLGNAAGGPFYVAAAPAADLSGAAQPAAYASLAGTADLSAAYASFGGASLAAAYATPGRAADVSAPYAALGRPADLSASYVLSARPTDLTAAYATFGPDLSAAYLTTGRPVDLAAPYAPLARPADLSGFGATYLAAGRGGDLSPSDYERLKADILTELRAELRAEPAQGE